MKEGRFVQFADYGGNGPFHGRASSTERPGARRIKSLRPDWQPSIIGLCIALTVGLSWACSRNPQNGIESQPPVKPTPIDQSATGAVMGTVFFKGDPPHLMPILMDEDPLCVKVNQGRTPRVADGEVNPNETLPNVFVWVKKGAEKYVFAPPSEPVVLNQVGCRYEPHVLGLMAGQILEVENSDPTTHNIHPIPKNNPQWNLSQLPGSPPLRKRFMHPEVMVPVKCSQHPWMKCYIGVTANPFYAVTGCAGTYTLSGLPPGVYTIGAWTAIFGTQEEQITVTPKQTVTLNFTFKSS